MKKISVLLLCSVICLSGFSQNRATLLKETFNGSTLPAGWTITNQNSNWKISNSNNAGGNPYELQLTWSPQFNGKTRVVSPVINTTGTTDLVIEFIHYLDNYSGSHLIGIETTSNGGTTWNPGWSSNYSSSGARQVAASLSTPDIGSSTFQFCLFYQGNSYNINDWFFDNFELYSRENLDAAVISINNLPYAAADYHNADFTVANRGTTTINTIEAEYQFGDLAPVVETFNALNMATLTSKTLSFTEKTFLLPGSYTLKVKILKVNGVTDDYSENDYSEKTIYIGISPATRRVCIEHFTSSTCGPCVSVNNQMKALLQSNPDKFGITKYQMSWPAPGDPYYTAEGGVRRTYYSVNAVPMVFFNGKNGSVNQNTFNTALNEPAFMDIAGTYNVSGTNINVNFDITSYLSTPEVRIYAIVNEKKTTGNVGSNGELEFFHVMMKMWPDANGTTSTFNQGETKSYQFTQDMAGTHVEEMSDLEVHVFVQLYTTKYIYNSNFLVESSTQFTPPNNLTLQNNCDGTVTTSWTAPTTGTPTYNIYLNDVLIKENHNTTSYVATLPPPQNGYYAFKVKAVYGTNISVPISNYVITSTSVPPTDLNLEQNGKDVVMTWVAPNNNVDYYNVYLDGALHKEITETSYTFVEIPAGEYIFGISSITGECESEIISMSFTVTNCPQPASVDAVQEGNDVILTWEAPLEDVVIDSYNVYLDGTLKQDNIPNTTFTYTFVNAPEGKHKYGVSATLGDCESDILEIEFTLTGISEMDDVFTIYPNPAESYFEIKGDYIKEVQLFNVLGQLVETISVNDNYCLITTSRLNSGIYFINIYSTDNQMYIKKLIIK